ncbi:MAG: DUF4440 domain-containing protein, partial [Candidatus Eiseniibacteriota bacterium]
TAELGVRNGFLMFFANDALSPPDSMPARMSARPAPVAPPYTTLVWEPLAGEVSRSLDLGWLTGPFSYLDGKGQRHHGVYFSIWRRDADGLWRVALDAGIGTPGPVPEFSDSLFRAAGGSRSADSLTAEQAERSEAQLRGAEAEFLAAQTRDARAAYAASLADFARLHRYGRVPLTARDSILAAVAREGGWTSAHVIRAEVSAAGDLGWTFGALKRRDGAAVRDAAFTRVWRRDAQGRWRIVVDVLSPAGE